MQTTFVPIGDRRAMPSDRSATRAFAHWFAAELRDRRLSQADFARRAGISSGLVSSWVTGTRTPGIQSAQAIAAGLDVDVRLVLAQLGLDTMTGADPDRSRLVGMLNALELTPERETMLASLLQMWAEQDRAASGTR